MQSEYESSYSVNRQWWRALRPLALWVLLVVALFAVRKHQQLIGNTRLYFTITFSGERQYSGSEARWDDEEATSGQNIRLGWHTFVVTHPKALPFKTNVFVWYGGVDFDRIELSRATGTLKIHADPPALSISVRGPEFRKILTNSTGGQLTVPTDSYRVEASYSRWNKTEEASVSSTVSGQVSFAPQFGSLNLTASHSGTSFQLYRVKGGVSENGVCPATLSELEEGEYIATFRRLKSNREQRVFVKAGVTNEAKIEFTFGAAMFDVNPNGTQVLLGGEVVGVTPCTLSELEPGPRRYELQRAGYESVEVSIRITPGETTTVRTNLVNSVYLHSMAAARESYEQGSFTNALTALDRALQAEPDNTDATTLKREASGKWRLQRAKEWARRGEYANATNELRLALEFLPDNGEAKSLNAEYSMWLDHAAKQAEEAAAEAAAQKIRQERADRADVFFTQWMQSRLNNEFFSQFSEKVAGEMSNVEAKLTFALTNGQPAFQVIDLKHPKPGLFQLSARQELGLGGWRRCDLVGGQSSDGEVTVVFKVFEYAYKEAFSIRAAIGDSDEKVMVPIHVDRLDVTKRSLLSRRAEGVELIRAKIRQSH